jgi:hypothetical protein
MMEKNFVCVVVGVRNIDNIVLLFLRIVYKFLKNSLPDTLWVMLDLSILQLTPLSHILLMGSVYLRHLGEMHLNFSLPKQQGQRSKALDTSPIMKLVKQ